MKRTRTKSMTKTILDEGKDIAYVPNDEDAALDILEVDELNGREDGSKLVTSKSSNLSKSKSQTQISTPFFYVISYLLAQREIGPLVTLTTITVVKMVGKYLELMKLIPHASWEIALGIMQVLINLFIINVIIR